MATSTGRRYVLSYGGGINSVALLLLLIQRNQPLDEVVFADTGGELPETYAYIEKIKAYLAGHKVPFTVLTRRVSGSNLYSTAARRKVIPSALWRWCTRDFKVKPIHAYYRSLGVHVKQYLAIAYDEWHRMKDSGVESITNLYPLVDEKLSRKQCIRIIEEAGWPIPVKSSCYFCPFGSLDRWAYIHERHPELYERAIALEEGSKHYPNQRLADQAFRNKLEITLRELRERFRQKQSLPVLEAESPCGAECLT